MPAKKTMGDQRKKRRGGFYWVKDEPYASVTKILGVIDKPALRYWFGKEVYYAMVQNPELSEKEALSAPYKSSKKAMQRGSDVHEIAENWKDEKINLDDIPEHIQGYGKAFLDWVSIVKPTVIENERSVYSEKHGYAGTMDMLAEINGKTYVVDFKTNKKGVIYDEAHLQMSAYAHALRQEGMAIEGCFGVGLAETGKYSHVAIDEDFDAFMAVKKLWEFKNRGMLEKIGYTAFTKLIIK